MDILIRNQAEEQEIVRICEAWARRFPERYDRFLEQIKREHEVLYKANGMSKTGRFAYEGKIPVDLAWVLMKRFPYLWETPRVLMFVHKTLMGKYRPKSSKDFHYIEKK